MPLFKNKDSKNSKSGKKTDFFTLISGLVEYSYEAAVSLCDTLKTFDPDTIEESRELLHKIEHTGDIKKHELIRQMANRSTRDFLSRKDIIRLAEEIDNVTDNIEDVIIRLCMYNVRDIPDEAIRMSEVVVRCTSALRDMLKEFRNFKGSSTINSLIIEVNRLEEESDRLYYDSMRKLYRNVNRDVLNCQIWSAIYEGLENCCDACEHVSDVVEQIIMKDS